MPLNAEEKYQHEKFKRKQCARPTVSEQLVNLRAKYNVSQRDMAKISGVPISTYRAIERGTTSPQSPTGKKVIEKTLENERGIERLAQKRLDKRNKYRIPNIPNFYERLRKVEQNGIKENNPDLIELQKDLGVSVKGAKKRTKVKFAAEKERIEFGKLLKKYRGSTSQRKFGKKIDVKYSNLGPIERGLWSSDSKAIQSLLTNDYFTAEQQWELTQVYERMRAREWEEEMEK